MTKLETLRKEIDRVDEQLIKLLEERFEIVRKIGEVKKELNLPIFDPSREAFVLASKKKMVQNEKDWSLFERIYKLLMELAKEVEK